MLLEYEKKVELLLEWYKRAKDVSIKAESIDGTNTGYIQPLHEQRYCLDHFIRAINFEKDKKTEETINKALDSAIGHLQRSYSDSIEWILVTIKEEYIKELDGFTSEQINKGFPEYYQSIRLSLDDITEQVNKYKNIKSAEKATNPDIISEDEIKNLDEISNQFLSDDVVEKLETYRKDLRKHIVNLCEIKKKDKKSAMIDKLLLPIITGIVGTIISGIIMFIILG